MRAFFVQIKCELGKSYEVATAIADAEIASEIYSTAGGWDLLVKFYLQEDEDVGQVVDVRLYLRDRLRRPKEESLFSSRVLRGRVVGRQGGPAQLIASAAR